MRGARRTGAERRVVEAFGAVRAPEGLRERTLERIEELRRVEKDAGSTAVPASAGAIVRVATPRRRRLAPRIAAAACLVVALLGAAGACLALAPTAYVGIDVNPSMELAVNRFGSVVGARALNEDGERVLSEASVMWRSYGDAVVSIGAELEDAGFLTEGSVVSVTVSCDDERQYDELSAASRDCLEGSAAEVCCDHASEEERRAAHDAGMGVGKWRAWQELVSEGSGVSAEDAAGMTMRELRDLCEGDEGAGAGEGAAVGGYHGEGRHGSGRHG